MVLAGNPTLVSDITAIEQAIADAAAPIAYQGSALNSSAVGSTATGVLTLPSTTFRAGRAYQIEVGGSYTPSTATAFSFWDLWKTAVTTGTRILVFDRMPVAGQVQAFHLHLTGVFVVGASDVTATLILAATSSASATVIHNGAASNPRYILARDVGPASSYPSAPTLT